VEKLIAGYLNNPGNIIAGRARKITKDSDNNFSAIYEVAITI